MKAVLQFAVVLSILCTAAFGQGARYDGISLHGSGGILTGASVYVCADPASGTPCTPLANLYSDVGLTHSLSNPLTSDAFGKFYFYALPGNYMIQVYNGSSLLYTLDNVSVTSSAIADKGGQVFNVMAYGAKCDGTTNDTTAIQTAWDAAATVHGTLFFPAATCAFSSPLNFTGQSAVTIESAGTPASGAGAHGAMLLYTGTALTDTCPIEFTNSSYIEVSGMTFGTTNPVACMALLGSASGESFHFLFQNDWFQNGATRATVANCGAENIYFSGPLGDMVYGGSDPIGYLASSNGCSGYGISSNFGYTFATPHSTTGLHFGPSFVFDGYGSGHAVELDGTGSGTPISFVSWNGSFCQVNQTATGAACVYAKGIVQDGTFNSPRCESDAGSNTSYFLQAATGALIENFDINRLNQSGGCGTALYAASGANATVSGIQLTGDAPAILWNGNIAGLHLQSYSSLNVTVSGSLGQSSLDSFTGHGSDIVSVSGSLNADINGLKNVVWYAPVFSGNSVFHLPSGGFFSGIYKATYISAGCTFIWSEGFGAGAGAYGTVSTVTGAVGYGGAQTLSCPSAGSYSSAQSVTATYTNTGGPFIVQQF